jgi:hypothetical protein
MAAGTLPTTGASASALARRRRVRHQVLLALLVALATACTPVAQSAPVDLAPTEAPFAWSSEQSIAALRSALRSQPFMEDAVEGPMVVLEPDDYLHRDRGALVATDPRDWWPDGAVLVETHAGRWWVWPGGAIAPADAAARVLAAHLPARPTLDLVVDWR